MKISENPKIVSDMTFFGSGGLTINIALYIIRRIDELVEVEEQFFNNLDFLTRSIEDIDGKNNRILSYGVSQEDIMNISDKIEHLVKLKTLHAWLYDATLAQRRIEEYYKNVTIEEWAEIKGVVLAIPEKDESLVDSIVSSNSVRVAYYENETLSSFLSNIIHDEGNYIKAYKELSNHILKNPREINKDNSAIVNVYTPSVSELVVNNIYSKLNKKYRDALVAFERTKAVINHDIEKHNSEIRRRNEERKNKFNTLYKSQLSEFNEWKHRNQVESKNLKIFLPLELKSIYEEVKYRF